MHAVIEGPDNRNTDGMLLSRRLLQPGQPPLWQHHRVLLTHFLSRDESNRRVRVPLA